MPRILGQTFRRLSHPDRSGIPFASLGKPSLKSTVSLSLVLRFSLLLGSSLISGCHQTAISSAPPPVNQLGSVWVADIEGQPGQLFLCGTIHVLRQSDYPLATGYEFAYQNAQRLLFELPPGASEAPEFNRRLMELGSYPKTTTLPSEVGPKVWAQVEAWARSRNKSTSSFHSLKPWLASLIITSEEFQRLGASNAMGVDQHYEQRSAKDGKPGQGLETVELQLQLFSGLDRNHQILMLEQTLEEARTMEAEYGELVSAWKKGDLEVLHNLINREAEKHPELMEIFINRRNRAWVPPLMELLKKGEKVMVLVGAGHLGGPDGLLSLLRKQGCRVRHAQELMPPTTPNSGATSG